MRIPRTLPLWLILLSLPGAARSQDKAPAPVGPKEPAAAPVPDDSPALPPAGGAGAGDRPTSKPFVDLTHRFRFSEQYTTREGAAGPELVGPYRVTIQETLRESVDAAQGAARPPSVRQVEYIERPAEVSGIGAVTATIRTYERFLSRPEDPHASGAPLLEGLTVWYRPRRDALPQLISLEGRRLREREYDLASHQIFVPGLTAILPSGAVRIGDSWRVQPKAVQALLGEPEVRGDSLVGKFVGLRRPPGGGATMQAVFSLTGRIPTAVAETLVNAEIVFTFAPTPTDRGTEPARKSASGDDSLIDARGAITDLRLARVAQGVLPAAAGAEPQKFRAEQHVVLERKLGGLGPVIRGIAPTTTPPPTVANSWLTYTDPKGRFSFQHPQDLLPPTRGQVTSAANPNAIFLIKLSPEGRDLIQMEVFGQRREPQALQETLKAMWQRSQADVIAGAEEWLPAIDWPSMKVFRIEAALKPPLRGTRVPRIHFDAYLLQLADDTSMTVIATTTRDAVPSYRRDVEQMLKTIRLNTGG